MPAVRPTFDKRYLGNFHLPKSLSAGYSIFNLKPEEFILWGRPPSNTSSASVLIKSNMLMPVTPKGLKRLLAFYHRRDGLPSHARPATKPTCPN
jgi:hypothetical protein